MKKITVILSGCGVFDGPLPGGFGAAKNLSNFAFDASQLTVDTDLERFLLEARKLEKPIGFACI